MELLTAADMARRLGVPYSTLDAYARRFAALLPHEQDGRVRRYHAEALVILRRVVDARLDGMSISAVEAMLTGAGTASEPCRPMPPTGAAAADDRAMVIASLRAALLGREQTPLPRGRRRWSWFRIWRSQEEGGGPQ